MNTVLSFRELQKKSVIRLCDGKDLGCVIDLRFDTECGRVSALVVSLDDGRLFSFAKPEIMVIPYEKIRCIGDDAILVCVAPADCSGQKDACRFGKCK